VNRREAARSGECANIFQMLLVLKVKTYVHLVPVEVTPA